MKVLVLNGSPKGVGSGTLKVTQAFIDGMGVTDYEIVDTMKNRVNPCLGCFSCWGNTPGRCVQNDGMMKVLDKMRQVDLVIWSFPLYCYGMPANLKAYADRMLPLVTREQKTDENGNTYHPGRENHMARHMMISGCGFPNRKGNYDGMIFAFRKMLGDGEIITCVENPLLNAEAEELEPVINQYLDSIRKAGKEYAENGCISEATHAIIDAPMYDVDEYRKEAGQN